MSASWLASKLAQINYWSVLITTDRYWSLLIKLWSLFLFYLLWCRGNLRFPQTPSLCSSGGQGGFAPLGTPLDTRTDQLWSLLICTDQLWSVLISRFFFNLVAKIISIWVGRTILPPLPPFRCSPPARVPDGSPSTKCRRSTKSGQKMASHTIL